MPATAFSPVCDRTPPCKCCGTATALSGVVDFHKYCDAYRWGALPLSGIPIYYHRCPACGFLFTAAFDDFTTDDFARHVYNDEYAAIDRDYATVRPQGNVALFSQLFAASKGIRILDYGGGNGLFAAGMRDAGFTDITTFDPFVPKFAGRPSGRFDCIFCFEVVEHSPRPAETFAEMNSLLTENGIVLFTTLLQPPDITAQGVNWWYAGPRNGHVSLFTGESLRGLTAPYGLQFASANDSLHILCRQVPNFARHFLSLPSSPAAALR